MIYLLLLAAAATAASEVFLDLPCFWKGILEPFLPHLSAWATSSQCVHAWRPTCVILSGISGVLVAAASIACMHVEVINYATPRARAGLPLTKKIINTVAFLSEMHTLAKPQQRQLYIGPHMQIQLMQGTQTSSFTRKVCTLVHHSKISKYAGFH